ncbi:MAG: hypothetical protein U5N56_10195 [Candidatus Marinimicrobia bacterium]|nr:hypothetical protein [Candidatus Neomarinimicrobiota bacterium]
MYASISSFISEFPKYQEKFILAFQDILLQLKIPMEDAEYFFRDKVNWYELADRISLQKGHHIHNGEFSGLYCFRRAGDTSFAFYHCRKKKP